MMEQTGEEIDWKRCPNDLDDFPDSVINALNIFHCMGNKIYPEIGMIGKDWTSTDRLFTHFLITEDDKEWIEELLIWLESYTVDEAQRKLKAEYDRMKRK